MEHCCDGFGYKAFLNPLAARSNMVVKLVLRIKPYQFFYCSYYT